jgi:K+-transporting ATPase ATPase C chain
MRIRIAQSARAFFAGILKMSTGMNRLLGSAPAVARNRRELHSLPVAAHVSRDPRYFWARPASSVGYQYYCVDCSLGDMNSKAALDGKTHAPSRRKYVASSDTPAAVPYELTAVSGTLLDPYISPAAAELQVARVANARALSEDEVRAVVASATEGPLLGFVGKPRVDVLMLNITLDRATPN